MTLLSAIFPLDTGRAIPNVRTIRIADLKDAIRLGFDDFSEMPSHAIFLCLIYPLVGFAIGWTALGQTLLPLIYPLIAGFALVGPVAAVGLYELSRRRERGLDASWTHAFDIPRSPSVVPIVILGLVLAAIFIAWLATALAIYRWAFPAGAPESATAFLREVLTTEAGWRLILVGNAVGFLFAAATLTVSVVSFPMLLDRPVDVVTAVQTSVRAVLANPVIMAIWGVIVAAALVVGCLPFFFGLAVVMPILGHTTWHLYRKVVAT
jgi:uncharacterized membrane protein